MPPTTTFQCLFAPSCTFCGAPTTTFQCLFARSRASGGANHPPRPFSECLLDFSPTSAGTPTATFQCLLALSRTSATSGRAPTTTFQCLFARSCTSGGTNPPPRHFNACLLVLAPTPHHDLSVSACFFFLPRLLVPPPRPFKACWLVLAHLVRPFSECLLLLSPTSVGAPTTIFQCLFARSCASGTPTPDRGLSMRACSFSHIGWCQTPHHDLSVSACWLFLPCLLVPPPTTTVRCLWVRSCTSGGANPPPRPFSECALVFFSLARAAVWCKGYCGNW